MKIMGKLQQHAFASFMQSTKSRAIVANQRMVLDANNFQPKMPTEKLKEMIFSSIPILNRF